jgi:hypothetical protein
MSLRVRVLASSDLDPSSALDLALDALEDLPHPCPKPFWRILRALMSDVLRLAPLSKDDLGTIIERCFETSLSYSYGFLDSYNISLASLLAQEPRLRLARELENRVRGPWCLLDRQRALELIDLIRAPILAAQQAHVNSLRARRPQVSRRSQSASRRRERS